MALSLIPSARYALATPANPASPRSSCLGEHGDLPDRDAAHLHQIAHRGVGFLGIARTVIEDIAIRRIAAHDVAAGVSPEEQHPPLERERHRDRRGRGADAADDAEDLVLLVELSHGLERARRLVAVIGGDDPQLPSPDAAGVVDLVEGGFDAELHLAAALPHRAGEGRRDAEPDFVVGYAADRTDRISEADRGRRRRGESRCGGGCGGGRSRRGWGE